MARLKSTRRASVGWALVAGIAITCCGQAAGQDVPPGGAEQKRSAADSKGRTLAGGLWIESRVVGLPTSKMGPFIPLDEGAILTVEDDSACISHDDGQSWECRPLLPNGPKFQVSNERALVRTRGGAVVLVCMNLADNRKWGWNKEKNAPIPDARLNVWSLRSLDGGKTWIDAQRIMEGYCGAIRDMIETSDGSLVVPVQRMLYEEARHATQPYVSNDDGKTWTPGPLLDIGGRGHHDGSIEGTLTELRDGRLWLLLRSNLDYFLSTYSEDGGRTWSAMRPSGIEASSAPAMLTRLDSGRLLMVWNRLYPEGRNEYLRRGGQYSQRPASWHREELSVAFSDDDGQTWSDPVVIARKPEKWISYPYVYEHRPGEIWITTMQGGLRVKIHESDFVPKNEK